MFCFTNILNIFFSFVTCFMHKNSHQNAGNGIKETLFFKIFLRSMAPDPLEVLAPSARVGQIRVRPPPKISKLVRLWLCWAEFGNKTKGGVPNSPQQYYCRQISTSLSDTYLYLGLSDGLHQSISHQSINRQSLFSSYWPLRSSTQICFCSQRMLSFCIPPLLEHIYVAISKLEHSDPLDLGEVKYLAPSSI